jgi:uncharacterized membrane protein YqjE
VSAAAEVSAQHAPGIGESAQRWWREAHGVLACTIEIALLEIRSAAARLSVVVACGIAAGLLVASAWLALLAAAASLAVDAGADWAAALGVAALLNLAMAGGLAAAVGRMLREIRLDRTLRQLSPDSAPDEHASEGPVHPSTP